MEKGQSGLERECQQRHSGGGHRALPGEAQGEGKVGGDPVKPRPPQRHQAWRSLGWEHGRVRSWWSCVFQEEDGRLQGNATGNISRIFRMLRAGSCHSSYII